MCRMHDGGKECGNCQITCVTSLESKVLELWISVMTFKIILTFPSVSLGARAPTI